MDSSVGDGMPEHDGTWTLELRPRDPILVRDARPFSADPGARAVTLDWPLPATIAGALRTHIGNAVGVDWSTESGRALVRQMAVEGPFLLRRGDDGRREINFPAPRDAVLYRDDDNKPQVLRLRPMERGALPAGAGSDLWPGLQPVRLEQEVKPTSEAVFWSASDIAAWLGDARSTTPPGHTYGRLATDVRTHVAIQPETLTSVEGALFSTEALAFDPRGVEGNDAPNEAMICRVAGAPPEWLPARTFLRIGGEGRQVEMAPVAEDEAWPQIPANLLGQLTGATRVRLLLVTPAVFARKWPAETNAQAPPGWLPEWLHQDTLQGKPAHWPGQDWTLESAVVGRRLPLSGWDTRTRQAKSTRYAVPAGSVFFFTLRAPLTKSEAASLWLRSISDRLYERRRGFGLALPGVWEPWERPKEGP